MLLIVSCCQYKCTGGSETQSEEGFLGFFCYSYNRLDRLMGELELERTTLVEAIAQPYVDPCYKQDPNYVVNQHKT